MRWGAGKYWYSGGVYWQAIISFLAGVAVSLLFANSPLFASPLMVNYFGGADFSLVVGILFTGFLYYFIARGSNGYKTVGDHSLAAS